MAPPLDGIPRRDPQCSAVTQLVRNNGRRAPRDSQAPPLHGPGTPRSDNARSTILNIGFPPADGPRDNGQWDNGQ